MNKFSFYFLSILLAFFFTACQQATVEPTSTVTNVPTMTETLVPSPSSTETSTPVPTKTLSPTNTITPPFWEQYPEGTPVPVQITQPETRREDYRVNLDNYTEIPVDFSEYYTNFLLEYLKEFDGAVIDNQDWIYDPVSIALRVTGHPNGDNLYPDEIRIHQVNEDHLIIFILYERCMDDSVASTEDRVELLKEAIFWRVEWYGSRWRCQLNRGHQDWGTELCH